MSLKCTPPDPRYFCFSDGYDTVSRLKIQTMISFVERVDVKDVIFVRTCTTSSTTWKSNIAKLSTAKILNCQSTCFALYIAKKKIACKESSSDHH